MFSILQVCTHCTRGLGPLLHADLLQIFQASGSLLATQSFRSLHRISGLRSGVWRVQSRTLKCLLCFAATPSCPGSHDLSQLLFLREGDCCPKSPIHSFMHPLCNQRSRPFPFAKRHPKEWCFHPHLFFPLYILIMHNNHRNQLFCWFFIFLQNTRFVLDRLIDFCFWILWKSYICISALFELFNWISIFFPWLLTHFPV